MVDIKLNFKMHISKLCRKAAGNTNAKRIRKYPITRDRKLTVHAYTYNNVLLLLPSDICSSRMKSPKFPCTLLFFRRSRPLPPRSVFFNRGSVRSHTLVIVHIDPYIPSKFKTFHRVINYILSCRDMPR